MQTPINLTNTCRQVNTKTADLAASQNRASACCLLLENQLIDQSISRQRKRN